MSQDNPGNGVILFCRKRLQHDARLLRGPPRWNMGRILLLTLFLLLPFGAQAADDGASTFDILEFVVEGNTVLPALDIERAVYPHLGEKKTIASVEAAREALEKRYHDLRF